MGVTFPPPDAPRTRGPSPHRRAVPLSFWACSCRPIFLPLRVTLPPSSCPWQPCWDAGLGDPTLAVGCGFCPSASGRSLCCAARSAGARPTLSGRAFLLTGALEHCVRLTYPQRVPLGPRPVPLAGTHVARPRVSPATALILGRRALRVQTLVCAKLGALCRSLGLPPDGARGLGPGLPAALASLILASISSAQRGLWARGPS